MRKRSPEKLNPEDFTDIIEKTPLVSVDLIVENNQGQILLGMRTNEPAKDCWFVPGGRILKDELITEAVKRVAKEELAIEVPMDDTEFVGVFEHLYETNFALKEGFGTHYVVLAHKIKIDESSIPNLPQDQHSQYKWFDKTEIVNDPKVHPNTKEYFVAHSKKRIDLL